MSSLKRQIIQIRFQASIWHYTIFDRNLSFLIKSYKLLPLNCSSLSYVAIMNTWSACVLHQKLKQATVTYEMIQAHCVPPQRLGEQFCGLCHGEKQDHASKDNVPQRKQHALRAAAVSRTIHGSLTLDGRLARKISKHIFFFKISTIPSMQ